MDYKNVDILIVEDDPNDAELTIRALRKHNHSSSIYLVRDGVEAVDFIFAEGKYSDRDIYDKPKVILLDLKLPKLNGLEVLQRIKSDTRTKTINIVVLTSSKEDKDINEAYKFGANSYIVKPVDFDKFISSIADIGMYWLIVNQPPEKSSA